MADHLNEIDQPAGHRTASIEVQAEVEQAEEEEVEVAPWCTGRRWACVAVGLLLPVGLLVAAKLTGGLDCAMDAVLVEGPRMMEWVHDRPGYIVLMMAAIALLDVVPGIGHLLAKPLQYSLPWIFGYPLGAAMIFACLYTSLTLQFLIGRHLLHDCVRRKIGGMRLFRATDRALSKERGLLLVCLLRANVLLPEVLTSYMLSVTRLSFFNYCIGSLVECGKNTPLQLYIAYTLDRGTKAVAEGGTEAHATLVRLGLGFVVALVTLLAVARLVHRELSRHGIDDDALRPSRPPARRALSSQQARGGAVAHPGARSERCWEAIRQRLGRPVEDSDAASLHVEAGSQSQSEAGQQEKELH